MNKFEQAILNQLTGQKVSQDCPVCNKKTDFVINKDGSVRCTKCNSEGKIHFSDAIKGLKELGVTVN